MGWPKKNETMRLYRDRDGSYLAIYPDECERGKYTALANVYAGPEPSLCGTSIGRDWFASVWPTRVEWTDLPDEWKRAFAKYLDDDERPESIRGFWRVGNQPAH